MTDKIDIKELVSRIENEYGSREGALFHTIYTLAMTGQLCDVCLYERKPFIDVKIKPDFVHAIMYGAGTTTLGKMLNEISLIKGGNVVGTVAFKEIWTINPMPSSGFTQKQLAEVDMSMADEQSGLGDETLREMIRNSYHCENEEEVEKYVRRFIAS